VQVTVNGRTLDLTLQRVDAVVNAANSSLMGGGGVDGAIHRAGGPAIGEECRRIVAERGFLPPGQAVITTGGRLPARYLIHTVGPIRRGGTQGEAKTLAEAYCRSLSLAAQHSLASVAFPSISTGAYGYPLAEAADVALGAVITFLQGRHGSIRGVTFVLFGPRNFEAAGRR